MKRYIPNFYYISLILLIAACSSPRPIQTGSYKYLYDQESQLLNPEYVLYHNSDDSSTVYFRINSAELLYTRAGSDMPFEARIQLKISNYDKQSNLKDSLTQIHTHVQDQKGGFLLGEVKIPIKEGLYNMVLELTDLNKNNVQSSYIRCDKSDRLGAQNFLLTYASTGEPCFNQFAKPNQKLEIHSARNTSHNLKPTIYQILKEIKLPPPPFSTSQPELPDLKESKSVETIFSDSAKTQFQCGTGLYFITCSEITKQGYMLMSTSPHFPQIKSTDQLAWPLRYITTKAEYDEMTKLGNNKKLIDNFWLGCGGGNKERARELIKTYYNRIEEANKYFSNYTEGWRTDRGMIHVVFGNPTKILKYSDSENWFYGEEGQMGTLVFNFKKVETPFSQNVYILTRDPAFKTYWERMVAAWRNGKIFNE